MQQIMKEENLVAKIKRISKYNAYAGEATPSVLNGIERNFSENEPNSKWLTYITEFAIPARKVYLSLIVDCFDGLLVAWKIGISTNITLVNTMLDDALKKIIS